MTSKIPLLRLDSQTLIVALHAEANDEGVQTLQTELGRFIELNQITGVVVDVSSLDIVDSYMARVLNDTAYMARLLGAQVVLCGIRPPVALTLVEMGHELLTIHTAFNLEKALIRLRQLLKHSERHHDLPEPDGHAPAR